MPRSLACPDSERFPLPRPPQPRCSTAGFDFDSDSSRTLSSACSAWPPNLWFGPRLASEAALAFFDTIPSEPFFHNVARLAKAPSLALGSSTLQAELCRRSRQESNRVGARVHRNDPNESCRLLCVEAPGRCFLALQAPVHLCGGFAHVALEAWTHCLCLPPPIAATTK